jgi:hypothetical protein
MEKQPMMTRPASLASFLFFAFAATTPACSSAPTSDLADENVATGAAALSTSIGTTGLSSITSNDPAAAATAAAEDQDGDECRTRTIDPSLPNVVHVVLKDCTGRLGRHHVSGNMTITFSANSDGSLHAEHQSDSLTIDGLPATHEASADITINGDLRHVTWHGVWTHTKTDGETATHTADHVIDIDRATHCRTVNGAGITHVGDRQIDSKITNFITCEGPSDVDSCPTGTIEHDNLAKQRTVTEIFDGSNVASVQIVKPKGETTRQVTLNCGPTSQVGQ